MPMRAPLLLLSNILIPFFAIAGVQAETYTYPQLVQRMTNMRELAKLPPDGEKTSLASSYDRRSKYDALSDKYIDWDANWDGGGIIEKEGDESVLANIDGRLTTWAVFWYATIFEHGGLCLNPYVSYVRNIGLDGSGVHGNIDARHMFHAALNEIGVFTPPALVAEDREAISLLNRAFDASQGNIVTRPLRQIYDVLPSLLKTPIHAVHELLIPAIKR